MDFEKNKAKFGSWAEHFRPFIESEDFDNIFKFIVSEVKRGKKVCPESKNTFRAFIETPYDQVKVIFVLQDPYPWIQKKRIKTLTGYKEEDVYVADGLAMSCSITEKCQPSLDLFYRGIEDELYRGLNLNMVDDPSLEYLAKQGVLLMNSSLTAELNKPGSHFEKWKPFMKFFFNEVINKHDRQIPVVFFGKQAQTYSKEIVPFHHWVLEASHPAAAAHKNTKWDSEGIFTKINTILKDNYGEDSIIKWVKEYERAESVKREDLLTKELFS